MLRHARMLLQANAGEWGLEDGDFGIDAAVGGRHVGHVQLAALEDGAGVEVERVGAGSGVTVNEAAVRGEHFDFVGKVRHHVQVALDVELHAVGKEEGGGTLKAELFIEGGAGGEQFNAARGAVVEGDAEDLAIAGVVYIQILLVDVEGQIIRAHILNGVGGNQRGVGKPKGELGILGAELEDGAQEGVGDVQVPMTVFFDVVGKCQAVRCGSQRGDLVGGRIDFKNSSVADDIVRLVEHVEVIALPEFANQADGGGVGICGNVDDIGELAFGIEHANVTDGGRAIRIRREIKVTVRVDCNPFGLPTNSTSCGLEVGAEVHDRAHRKILCKHRRGNRSSSERYSDRGQPSSCLHDRAHSIPLR